MKKTSIIFSFLFIVLLFPLSMVGCGESKLSLTMPLGVWWWDNRLDDEYFDFAVKNGVDEIYYYTYFTESSADFIAKAKDKGIETFALCGDYRWIENYQDFQEYIDDYRIFQANYPSSQFAGIHVDVEPHQHPDFDSCRQELITEYIEFVYRATTENSDIKFDFDIPFWLEDEITFQGNTKQAYKFVIDYANRVFVMSYRDSAIGMLSVASEEIEYAHSLDKQIFLGAETGEEEDIVTFMQEGKDYFYSQMALLEQSLPYSNIGLSIHDIKRWKALKN